MKEQKTYKPHPNIGDMGDLSESDLHERTTYFKGISIGDHVEHENRTSSGTVLGFSGKEDYSSHYGAEIFILTSSGRYTIIDVHLNAEGIKHSRKPGSKENTPFYTAKIRG